MSQLKTALFPFTNQFAFYMKLVAFTLALSSLAAAEDESSLLQGGLRTESHKKEIAEHVTHEQVLAEVAASLTAEVTKEEEKSGGWCCYYDCCRKSVWQPPPPECSCGTSTCWKPSNGQCGSR